MKRTSLTLVTLSLVATGCGELPQSQDRSGNHSVEYADNLRVFIGDELVAEVQSGEDATVEWDGQSFQVSQICSEDGTECPSETFWGEIAIDQPWGPDYNLLNIVNLDLDSDNAGQRMGGILNPDGSFDMLAGLAVAGNGHCAVLGVATVEGIFDANNDIQEGVIAYEWAAGCQVDEVVIGTTLRLETDFTTLRTGDLDLSSVAPEEPIDEDGIEIDPGRPDGAYASAQDADADDDAD